MERNKMGREKGLKEVILMNQILPLRGYVKSLCGVFIASFGIQMFRG